MSSFQSFKSFAKFEEQRQNATLISEDKKERNKCILPNQNKQIQQGNESNDQINNLTEENKSKSMKRIKKPGAVCNFISKIYIMLEQKQIQNIVSWVEKPQSSNLIQKSTQPDRKKSQNIQQTIANSFQILDVQKFELIVLPQYFKHSNLSSFVRQLNMYGFHKLRSQKDNFQFQHQKFQKNKKQLLTEIRRKSPEFIGAISLTKIQDKSIMKFPRQQEGRVSFCSQNNPFSQQDVENQKSEQIDNNNIFPYQSFISNPNNIPILSHQSESEHCSIQQERINKIQTLEKQNILLKKIKQSKIQRIKDLNSINKQKVDIKFAKIIFSFFSQKYRQEELVKLKVKSTIEQSLVKNETSKYMLPQKNILTLNNTVDHILSNKQSESFQEYRKLIKKLMRKE